ncbi:MAG: hypothetical protein V5A45_02205 [Haloarculaceae archaeon]
MRKSDLLSALAALLAVGIAGVAVSVLVDRNVSIVEFLFVALPVMFVLSLCWQASKYYIVVSEDDAAEWDVPRQPTSGDSTTSTDDATRQTADQRSEKQTHSRE